MKKLLSILTLLYCNSVYPSALERLIENNCSTKIPTHIVKKIILHESKSFFNNKAQAWPWTLNVDGRSHYYETKAKAVKAAQFYISNGRVVDLGLGQINWKYHKHRFNEIVSNALDPRINIREVCAILAEAKDDKRVRNWHDATAYYHRVVLDDKAYKYAQKVFAP